MMISRDGVSKRVHANDSQAVRMDTRVYKINHHPKIQILIQNGIIIIFFLNLITVNNPKRAPNVI